MDENVRSALAAGEEAETAQPVEPLHLGPFEPAGRGHRHVRPGGRQLRGMNRRRVIHGEDAESLQALRPLQHLNDDARAFVSGLETVTTHARHVQQDVRQSVVGHDEAVALSNIEPLDDTRQLDDACSCLAGDIVDAIQLNR